MKILLTSSRTQHCLHLARLFNQGKHIVYAVDNFKTTTCRGSTAIKRNLVGANAKYNISKYIQSLINIVKKHEIDIIYPSLEEVLYLAKYKNLLNNYCDVFCDTYEKLINLHDKYNFIKLAKEISNFNTPITKISTSIEQLNENIKILLKSFPKIVLKPVYSRAGAHVFATEKSTPLIKNLEISKTKPWIVQQFIEGDQLCTYSVANNGKIIAHSSYISPLKKHNAQGMANKFINDLETEEFAINFVKKLNFHGQIAFDFLVNRKKEIFVLECNPRCTPGIFAFDKKSNFARTLIGETAFPNNNRLIKTGLFCIALAPELIQDSGLKNYLKVQIKHRDIVFMLNDPLPALCESIMWLKLLIKSRTKNMAVEDEFCSGIALDSVDAET